MSGRSKLLVSGRSKLLVSGALWGATFFGLYLVQRQNFLLFHSLAELFSIVIAGSVFLVGWNSRARLESDFLLIVSIAYAFVALLDALHLLSYAGMGVFSDHTANLPTQLWLAARYLETGAILVATAFVSRPRLTGRLPSMVKRRETSYVVLAFGVVTATLIGTIFLGVFPPAFVAGVGLTPFKIASEYVIIGLLAVVLWQLSRHRDVFDRPVFDYLVAVIVLTMAAELSFTMYVSVYGWSNMVGHLLKIASFYLLYLAVVKTGITEPQELLFRQLTTERDDLVERERQLEQQNERLAGFSNIVSHDLRSPLAVAQGRLELALNEHDSEHLEVVQHSHSRMEVLIEDLLRLARHGTEITEYEWIRISENAELAWSHVAAADATLTTETDAVIRADGIRVLQLFENLFRNAVEHGGETVTVRVGTLTDAQGFYVEDDGDGIPPGDRERVFDHGYSTAQESTGFGLSIVANIVDAHSWSIRITEGTAGGARFEVTGVEFEQ